LSRVRGAKPPPRNYAYGHFPRSLTVWMLVFAVIFRRYSERKAETACRAQWCKSRTARDLHCSRRDPTAQSVVPVTGPDSDGNRALFNSTVSGGRIKRLAPILDRFPTHIRKIDRMKIYIRRAVPKAQALYESDRRSQSPSRINNDCLPISAVSSLAVYAAQKTPLSCSITAVQQSIM